MIKYSRNTQTYRSWVGPSRIYDVIGASQFSVLTMLGLREHHKLLDIGCGSLRLGRFCIVMLEKGNYFGLDPMKNFVEEGINENLNQKMIKDKSPFFEYNDQFDLSAFGQVFDFAVAQSIFTHASKKQIKKCLSEVRKVLNPNGFFIFNWNKGEKDYERHEWVYPACVSYKQSTIETMMKKAGLCYRYKSFSHLEYKSDWVVATLNESNFERIKRIPDLEEMSNGFKMKAT